MATGTAIAPARALRTLARDPFRFFERMLEEPGMTWPFAMEEAWPLAKWSPSCDVFETDKEYVIKAELPGLKKEDVSVGLENNVLTIRGERKFEEETARENYHRVERRYGEFMRSFTLPAFVDAKKITADFHDGLLKVMLPKLEEAKPKQIEVKIS